MLGKNIEEIMKATYNKNDWDNINYEELKYLYWDLSFPDFLIAQLFNIDSKEVTLKRYKMDITIPKLK